MTIPPESAHVQSLISLKEYSTRGSLVHSSAKLAEGAEGSEEAFKSFQQSTGVFILGSPLRYLTTKFSKVATRVTECHDIRKKAMNNYADLRLRTYLKSMRNVPRAASHSSETYAAVALHYTVIIHNKSMDRD